MISILLAVYNGQKYIHQSIESILDQTFSEWELLIGFNGTTDNSKKIVASYQDNRIKTFDYGQDKGKAKTLNKLVKESQYDWLAMQDDDDIWLNNKLAIQNQYINDYDVIGTYIKYIDEQGYTIDGPTLASSHNNIKNLSLSGINQIANSSSIFSKACIEKAGGWKEDIDGIEDFDLWKRLLLARYEFYNVPNYLTLHRIHSASNFNAKSKNN